MVQEVTITLKKQTAEEGCWLYKDLAAGTRYFTKEASLGVNDKEWDECTDKEKEQWELNASKPSPDAPPLPEDVLEEDIETE